MDSSSDTFDVQQKKNPGEVVKWNEYEALHDYLKLGIDKAVDHVSSDL